MARGYPDVAGGCGRGGSFRSRTGDHRGDTEAFCLERENLGLERGGCQFRMSFWGCDFLGVFALWDPSINHVDEEGEAIDRNQVIL